MHRRTVLAGVAAALAGCPSLGEQRMDTPTDEPPPVQAGPGDFPHEIRVENPLDRSVSITLAVERDDATIYEGTHDVAAGSTETVAGFTRDSFPRTREYVTIRASTATGRATSAGVSVTECLGDVVVSFEDSGTLELTYSIC